MSASGFRGNTLQAAVYKGSESIVLLLLDRGADINARDGCYGNAVQAATREGREAIVCLLLYRGANINAQGGLYENALQAAVHQNKGHIANLLVERGTDLNHFKKHFDSCPICNFVEFPPTVKRALSARAPD